MKHLRQYFHLCMLGAALTFTLTSGPVLAHSDEYLDTVQAPHGGQLRMAGAQHFELVARRGEIMVYVTGHAGDKINTKGANGSATVLAGKTKAIINLVPAGDNMLKGAGQFELSQNMKVVLSVSLPGNPAQQVRFTPALKGDMAGGRASDTMAKH